MANLSNTLLNLMSPEGYSLNAPCGLEVIPRTEVIADREIVSKADANTNIIPYTIFTVTAIVAVIYFWRKK
jgi:hypothetical protein